MIVTTLDSAICLSLANLAMTNDNMSWGGDGVIPLFLNVLFGRAHPVHTFTFSCKNLSRKGLEFIASL